MRGPSSADQRSASRAPAVAAIPASTALSGALKQIAGLGGGLVESYPADTTGLFEAAGFSRTRRIGKDHWILNRVVRRSRSVR